MSEEPHRAAPQIPEPQEPALRKATPQGTGPRETAPRNDELLTEIQGLLDTVRQLVHPGGCAWHHEQTHESLVRYLIEESAELAEAIETQQPASELQSELGDVLYQVLFHAAIAERDREGYDLLGITQTLNQKLILRHPHVFGSRGPLTVDELNAEWEHLKEDANGQARGTRGPLDGIPRTMPGLARATKIIDRLARADTPEAREALAAVIARGVSGVPAGGAAPEGEVPLSVAEEQLGNDLLTLLIRAQATGADADRALRNALRALGEAAEMKE